MVRIGYDVTTVANIFKQAAWTSTSPRTSQTILFALDHGLESQLYKACLIFIAEPCILANEIMLTQKHKLLSVFVVLSGVL